jgi:hypothetical protein
VPNTDYICPRCLGFIPSNERPGAYPGALSRVDNETEICSACGMEEATLLLASKDQWPVQVHFSEPYATDAKNRSWARQNLNAV